MPKLSSEFQLAAACCRWPPSPERDDIVRARAGQVDWERFARVAKRQRVEGLIRDALVRAGVTVPAQLAAEFQDAAGEIALQNLALAAESRRIGRLLDDAGIEHLFVKGATLDMLAYRTLALKRTRDIDLLIDGEEAIRAADLLGDAGYVRIFPGPEIGPDQFPQWVALCKETNWLHAVTGLILELHTDLVDNPELLAGVGLRSPTQIVEIGSSVRLPTLASEELYAYICVHGATHGWSRMKWIADVNALLSHQDEAGLERLHRAATRFGAGRASAQALLLCQALFDRELARPLLREVERGRASGWLVRVALRVMADPREAELDDTVMGTLPIHLSHFALGTGWRFKFAELSRKLNNHEDRVHVPLPELLHFLYPVISLPRWLWRRVRGPSIHA